MRLARIEYEGRNAAATVDAEGRVFLLGRDLDFAAIGKTELARMVGEVEAAVARGEQQPIVPDRWLPPVRPGKVIGVALNNGSFAPLAYRYFTHPAFFMKAPSALVGHGEPVILRREYGLTHPEAELACVIGRRCSRLTLDNALDAVFGYTIINDVTSVGLKDEDSVHLQFPREPAGYTAPGWRRERAENDWDLYLTYHFRSKCTDTFGPIGPWITTADAVPDPDSLAISAWLGDRLIASDNTANLSFPVAEVLVHLSRHATLEVGDVVHFGTAVDPARFALREADLQADPRDMRIEIDGLGTLVSPVRIIEGED